VIAHDGPVSDSGSPAKPSAGSGESIAKAPLSTSLFDDLWVNALDPSYAEAARSGRSNRRSAGRDLGVRTRTVLILLGVGLLVALAVGDVRRHTLSSSRTHAALVAQINARERAVTALEKQLGNMRRTVNTIQEQRLAETGEGTGMQQQLDALDAQVAAVAVSGPGLVVRLTDAPIPKASASAGTGQNVATRAPITTDAGQLSDRDLQDVVNALWAAGAEAIAINGQRLGPASAIRTAGSAVLVDFRPVTSPYAISAIGGKGLETSLADSPIGRALSTRSSVYGIGFSLHHSGRIALPATPPVEPVDAVVVPSVAASSASASPGSPQ
jgi:uncharacterized protein YlxW (UPF0749 family)